jgi:hypothetical protein
LYKTVDVFEMLIDYISTSAFAGLLSHTTALHTLMPWDQGSRPPGQSYGGPPLFNVTPNSCHNLCTLLAYYPPVCVIESHHDANQITTISIKWKEQKVDWFLK